MFIEFSSEIEIDEMFDEFLIMLRAPTPTQSRQQEDLAILLLSDQLLNLKI